MITEGKEKIKVCWWCQKEGVLEVMELESGGLEVDVHTDCGILIQMIQTGKDSLEVGTKV